MSQMFTHENLEEVVRAISEDSVLVDMLAANPPFYKEDGILLKVNSIVPMQQMQTVKHFPALGVSSGVLTKVGRTHLLDALIYIRCYNNKDKSFVDINKILSRIETVVTGNKFELTDMVNIRTLFENISIESVDDAYQLKFREIQFRLQII